MRKRIIACAGLAALALLPTLMLNRNTEEKVAEVSTPAKTSASKTSIQSSKLQTQPEARTFTAASPEVLKLEADFHANTPDIRSLKSMTDEDVHEASQPVLTAGQNLAEAREYFIAHPQPPEVEMKFYLGCANAKELFDSVRAVCAARASQKYREITGKPMAPGIFGARIARLRDLVEL